MATNENVNKVIYGNQTVMDITDTTAEEADVASGEVFYKANGERSVGTLNKDSAVWGNIGGTLSDQTDLQIELNRTYTKTASETSSIDDLDLIPVQKISASSDGRRNVKFRNLKSILKGFFDDIYQAILTFDNTPTVNSDNPVKSSGIYNALMPKVSESLLKSTVGWTGKNDLEILDSVVTKTESGVTITVTRNSKGQVTEIDADTNGNPSSARVDFYLNNVGIPIDNNKSYILNGCTGGAGNTYRLQILSSDSSVVKSCENSEVAFNGSDYSGKTVHSRITIYSGTTLNHVKFYPMLRDASITDDTYKPYHKSVEDWGYTREEANVMGAKNWLPNKASSGEVDGITWTVNADKTIKANGTKNSSDAGFVLFSRNTDNYKIPSGQYIFSGFPKEASATNNCMLKLQATRNGSLYQIASLESDEEQTVTIYDTDVLQCVCYVLPTKTVSNVVFKPMLRLASDPDDTYVPYAMTNRELTDTVTPIESAVTDIISGASVDTSNMGNHLRKVGKIVFLELSLSGVTATAWTDIVFKIPNGFKPKNDSLLFRDISNQTTIKIYQGSAMISSNLSNAGFQMQTSWVTS